MTLFSQTHATCNCNNISFKCFLIALCLSSLLCYEYTFICVLKKRRSSYLHFTVTWNLNVCRSQMFSRWTHSWYQMTHGNWYMSHTKSSMCIPIQQFFPRQSNHNILFLVFTKQIHIERVLVYLLQDLPSDQDKASPLPTAITNTVELGWVL